MAVGSGGWDTDAECESADCGGVGRRPASDGRWLRAVGAAGLWGWWLGHADGVRNMVGRRPASEVGALEGALKGAKANWVVSDGSRLAGWGVGGPQ